MAVSVVDAIAFGLDNDIAGMNPVGMNVYGAFDSVNAASSYADFDAPLKKSLVLTRGTGSPTYTRATTAYVKDFEGVWRQVQTGAARFEGARVVRQCIANSEVPSGVGSVTLTAGQSDPFGGTSAYKCVYAAAGSGHRFTYPTAGATPVGVTGTISIYMRGEVGGESIKLWDGWTVQSAITLTTEWKRYSFSITTNSSISVLGYADTGTPTIYIHAAQGEAFGSAIPSEYVSVGVLSAPYHGAGVDGVKYFDTENGNTVASNVVTEATGAAIPDATLKGYFAEGQRQNRCLYSQDFSNAAWVSGGGGIAVTPNTAVAPDGTTTADTLTASGANGTLIQDLGVVASAAKAGGLYLKRKTGTGNIDLTLDGGATWTTVAVTSSWLLLEKTQTLADEDFGIRIVTSGDAVYAWQAQVETAAFNSSPIPTTTAAVTRNADVLTYVSTGNISNTAGSVYAEYYRQALAVDSLAPAILGDSTTGSSWLLISGANYTATIYDSTAIGGANIAQPSASTLIKGASRWSTATSKMAATFNGNTSIYEAAYDGTFGTPDGIRIGLRASGNNFYGTIRNVKIWTTAKTDAQLQALTA